MPLKNCHCTFSAQRSTNSSSLRLKLFFRYSRLTIKRMGSRGRPAGLMPPPPRSTPTAAELPAPPAGAADRSSGPGASERSPACSSSNPPEIRPLEYGTQGITRARFTPKSECSCGLRGFCRADYVMGRSYGAELVQENDATAGNTDVMQFLSGVAADQIWLRQVGNDLEVSIIGTADKATVQNWYLGSQYHVEQF